MKIRTGFVSNSSSSSFIVEFENVPTSKEELHKILFGDRKEYHSPYEYDFWDTKVVSDIVWNDLIKQKPATIEVVKDELHSGYPEVDNFMNQIFDFKEEPEIPKDNDADNIHKWSEEVYKSREQYLKLVNEKSINDGKVFIFEYSDNDSSLYSAMEHGNLFENVKSYLKISKH